MLYTGGGEWGTPFHCKVSLSALYKFNELLLLLLLLKVITSVRIIIRIINGIQQRHCF